MPGPIPTSGIQVHPSVMYGSVEGTKAGTSTGSLAGRKVEVRGQAEVSGSREVGLSAQMHASSKVTPKPLSDRSVQVDGHATPRHGLLSKSSPEGTSPKTTVSTLQARDATSITREEIGKALAHVGSDPSLEKLKNEQKPQGFWAKVADYFSSGSFLKLLPKVIGGPIWSLLQEARATRSANRMAQISEDAAGRSQSSGKDATSTLPHELASALAGHYQNKAGKASDEAMIGTMTMLVSPLLGPVMAPVGNAVSHAASPLFGVAVEKGVPAGVVSGGKIAAKELVSKPQRQAELVRSEAFQHGERIELGGAESANSARAARAFLKYLGMPPRENLLKSPHPEVRQQEESRLLLKRSMGAEVGTDYNKEVRTYRDQMEKMASQGGPTHLSSDEGMLFSAMGVGSQEFGTDYLRRMMVSEGMIEHSIESLAAKDR